MTFNDINRHERDGLICFDPSRHVYKLGDEELPSVTSVVEDCFEKFDKDYWAARKRPDDPESLIKEWDAKAAEARDLGTLMHDRIERYYLGEQTESEALTDPTFRHFLNFARDYQLNPYRTEWRIFSERYHIAGTLDMLATDNDGRAVIYDWKRSTKVVDASGVPIDRSFGRYAIPPLDCLLDTTYNHYALQVSIYRFILSEHYGIDVAGAYLGVFHPSMPRHYRVPLPYLRDEVVTLLNYRLQ